MKIFIYIDWLILLQKEELSKYLFGLVSEYKEIKDMTNLNAKGKEESNLCS